MISIIIPAYNEGKRIGKTLEEYSRFFEEKARKNEIDCFEIIVVANACKDDTAEVAESAGKKFKEIKLLDFKEGGKGFAVKEGFKKALKGKADLIGFVDADMATPPFVYYDLLKNIKNYDGIIASRHVKGAVLKPKQPFARILASRIFNFTVRSLFFMPYRDTQCGSKLFKREVIERVLPNLEMTQWAFDIDVLYNARKQGFRIKEMPTFWQDIWGSKINLKKSSMQMFLAVLQLRILNSPAKKFWRLFKPISKFLYTLVK